MDGPAAGRGAGRILLAICTTAATLVLLFGYRTSTPGGAVVAAASAPAATTVQGGTSYSGDVVPTRWGPVQVSITVAGGRVVAATAVQVPSGNRRDEQINARAVPVLDAEAVQAQSADIDAVSGATVTSDGYVQSLQSALDAAHL